MDPDALLMELVDEVLARAGQDREAVYVNIRERHPDLYAEVKDRVEWEERMGGFLCEPVMAAEPVRTLHGRWALAGVVVVIATLLVCFWAGRGDEGRPELLIILPGPAGSLGVGEEVAERLGVIGPSEALRQGVDTPELARTMLGIGHSVRATAKAKELIGAIRQELHLAPQGAGRPARPLERPDFYGYWVARGAQWLERGDASKAEQAYRRAIALGPSVAEAHTGLGAALVRQHRYEEAEAALLAALGLRRSRETLRRLGELYAAEGRLAEAARFEEESGTQ
jgi:tetratricopeptide (TPR) repeat protein